jgi:hypothetical protein
MKYLSVIPFCAFAVFANANSREAVRLKNKESRMQQRENVEQIIDKTHSENDSLRDEMREADSPEKRKELHSEIKENREEAKENIKKVREQGRTERAANRKGRKQP